MPPAPEPACEPVDWNAVWAHKQRLQESTRHFEDSSHNWNDPANAKRYAANSEGQYDDRVKTTIAGLDLSKDMKVLDIGAGPGTLAIPLAPRVREITAVEPGAGMVLVLKELCKEKGISNITCVQKLWEDVDPARDLDPPYDLVIASLSLTMEDIRAALKKMDAVSRKYVCLYWFVDMPFWERMYVDLWKPLHGETYYPGPKADCLFEVLYQMEIYANVEMMLLPKQYRFSTPDEMTGFFRRRFRVTTQKQERVLDDYLATFIRQDGDKIVVSGNSMFAKIWWEKTERSG
ncbi:MAG TPA: class I SAM-dependent methyltransferase [Methanoregula sp.]|nr:class I SAM-dependent methyltransferase [Methanoregula sp.]